MAYTNIMQYEPMRSIDSATFSGSYQKLGTPLAHQTSIVKMVNNSTDGVTDYDVCPGSSFFLYDITSDKSKDDNPVFIPQGTQYFVKGSAGTGLVYLVVQYIMTV
jgi:hypothetical protein